MRIFTLIAILVTVLIIGWFSASYLSGVTGGLAPVSPSADRGTSEAFNPVERARELVSADRTRQMKIQEVQQ